MGLIWDKKLRRYIDEEEILTPKEIDDRHKRIKNAMRAADKRAQAIEDDKITRSYCPKCRFLLPLSGECDCGYKKPETTPATKPFVPQKNYINPAIMAMYK